MSNQSLRLSLFVDDDCSDRKLLKYNHRKLKALYASLFFPSHRTGQGVRDGYKCEIHFVCESSKSGPSVSGHIIYLKHSVRIRVLNIETRL